MELRKARYIEKLPAGKNSVKGMVYYQTPQWTFGLFTAGLGH